MHIHIAGDSIFLKNRPPLIQIDILILWNGLSDGSAFRSALTYSDGELKGASEKVTATPANYLVLLLLSAIAIPGSFGSAEVPCSPVDRVPNLRG